MLQFSHTFFQSRGEERDREDAISFASRGSRKSLNPRDTGARSSMGHHRNTSASMRSKRSTGTAHSASKKYHHGGGGGGGGGQDNNSTAISPPGTSYTLWSSQHSLKREHRRKFNRSLCGILLGISIVLVILGILGIIGIAVYLGGKLNGLKSTALLRTYQKAGYDTVTRSGVRTNSFLYTTVFKFLFFLCQSILLYLDLFKYQV